MKYTTLDNIIKQVCIANGDADFGRYVQVANFARMAVAQLQLYLPHALKTVKLEVGANYQAALPGDCAIVEKVGVMDRNGRIALLWRDDKLRRYYDEQSAIQPEDCECDDETTPAVDNTGGTADNFSNFFYTPNQYSELYGYMPTRFPWGAWRHNVPMGRLEFSTGEILAVGDDVFVEYRMAENAELYHQLPNEAEMVIFHKTLSLLHSGQKVGVAQYNDIQFRRQWEHLKRLYRRLTPEEMVASLRQHTKGGPKW